MARFIVRKVCTVSSQLDHPAVRGSPLAASSEEVTKELEEMAMWVKFLQGVRICIESTEPMVHAYDPRTREAETGRFQPAQSPWQVPGQ